MQRLLIILFGFLFLFASALATKINYIVTFTEKDFSIRETNKYHVIENSQCSRYGEIGAPQVLVTTLSFIIPPDETIESIDINSIKSSKFEGEFNLFPVQPEAYYMSCCDSLPDWVDPDSIYYNSNNPYPNNIVVNGGTGYFDGANHIGTVMVFPVYYIATNKELYFYENIEFTINLKSSTESPILVQLRMRQDQQIYDDILSEIVKNPQDIQVWGYQPNLSDTAILRPGPGDPQTYPFVIITRDSLKDYWAGYVDWLNRKGKRAGVVTMEEVVSYNLADDPELNDHANLLRGYLKYAYEHGTVWVLLGGLSEPKIHGDIYNDIVNVPVRYVIDDGVTQRGEIMCTPCPYGSSDGRCGWIAADIYYSDFTTDWEVDGDGYPGELGPPPPTGTYDLNNRIDRFEELFLGRVPVLNGNDIIRWTQKILNYEQNPGNGNFSYLLDVYWSMSDELNNEENNLQRNLLQYFVGFHPPQIQREEPNGNASNPTGPTGSQVIAQMSQYPAFINWHHHGNYCSAALRTPYNDLSNVLSKASAASDPGYCECPDGSGCGMNYLTNVDKPGFLYSCDCEEADFSCAYGNEIDYERKSVGSAYILEDNGGVGFIGTSRFGMVGGSADLKVNFLQFIFNSTSDIDHHKIGPSKVYWSTAAISWDYLANQTILGSPEQLVWSAIPQHLTVIPDYVNARVRVLYQNTPVSGARVCCSSRDLTKHIVMESDNNGHATIPPEYQFGDLDETIDITVTKHNYIPYQIIGSGQLVDNLTWRGDIAFYGEVEIPIDRTLVIKPGSTIRIIDGGLNVRGNITIEGDSEYPVILTSANENPSPGDWGRIFVDEGSSLEMRYCHVNYAQDAILAVEQSSVDIRNCQINNSQNSAITAISPELIQVSNSEFNNNNLYAIYATNAINIAQFTSNKILGHHNFGIKYLGGRPNFSCQPVIEGNRIEYSPGAGMAGIYIEKDELLDAPTPQIVEDTVLHYNAGILLLDTDNGTYIGPGVQIEGNAIGLYMERSYGDIIGSTGHGNSISNNSINMWGITTYGEVRWTAIENYTLGGGGVEINDCYMDWGRLDDWGNNSFIKSPLQYYPYMYITESPTNPAIYNWWGTTTQAEIEEMVTECVAWSPYLNSRPLLKQRTENPDVLPMVTTLFPAIPNPFNAESRIQFNLGQTARVKLTVYNILGQEIKTLCNMELSPGSYSFIWDGRDLDGKQVSSGVYLYSLRTPEKMITNKMVMLK